MYKAAASRIVRWLHRLYGTVTTHHSLEDSNACVRVVTWGDGQLDTITITNGYRLISAVFLRLQWYRHKEGKLWSSGWRDIQSHTVWMPFTMYLTNSEIDWRYTPVFMLNISFFLSRLYRLINMATWVGMGPLFHFGFIVWLKFGHSWEETRIRRWI